MKEYWKLASGIVVAVALVACGPPPEPEWGPEPTADPAAAPTAEVPQEPEETPADVPPVEEQDDPFADEPEAEDPFAEEPVAEDPPAMEPPAPAPTPPLSQATESLVRFAVWSALQEPLVVSLEGNGEAGVSGSATISEAPNNETEIAVRLEGEATEAPLAVRLVQGTCAAPEEEIVALYDVEVDAEGQGANSATINVPLETLLQAQTAVQVVDAAAGAEAVLCGEVARGDEVGDAPAI